MTLIVMMIISGPLSSNVGPVVYSKVTDRLRRVLASVTQQAGRHAGGGLAVFPLRASNS